MMKTFTTEYRVIYGDTDQMGIVYYANYLRWFEIGRTEALRALGVSYRDFEDKGYQLPVAEAHCKYFSPARYDDLLTIETCLDTAIKGYMKFDYTIRHKEKEIILTAGYTKHPYLSTEGKVVRPPRFLIKLIKEKITT